ncbi:unnamed protein product [Pleuronectes platessa]|uniref:G-protein coupled receptors family 1 profile domain-containing protein n=1 Tax=Pleuronectes platessa TaxID=8262 RepID=A0A9N7VE58_PLEPL|nr:unnamed protein product [Pleuronectes platessa]
MSLFVSLCDGDPNSVTLPRKQKREVASSSWVFQHEGIRTVIASTSTLTKPSMDLDYKEYEDYTPDNETENVNATPAVLMKISSSHSSLAHALVVFYRITSHWPFGLLLCKFTSSALFLNMYSSVFLLVLISTDRCVMILFPIWSHNHRQTVVHGSVTQCYTGYMDHYIHRAVVLSRFICGFLIPFLIIIVCCSVLGVKLNTLTVKSTKPYKIMAALILSFFFCWVPYHTFVLLELDLTYLSLEVIKTGMTVGATLAAANCFISPALYVFVGNDFKQTLKRSLTSRMEEAMAEDFRTGGLNNSRCRSMEVIKT